MDSYTDVSTQCCGRGRMSCGTSHFHGTHGEAILSFPILPLQPRPLSQPICHVPLLKEACWSSSFR